MTVSWILRWFFREKKKQTLWRWKVISSTSIITSLGNPVVQNLKQIYRKTSNRWKTKLEQWDSVVGVSSSTMLALWNWVFLQPFSLHPKDPQPQLESNEITLSEIHEAEKGIWLVYETGLKMSLTFWFLSLMEWLCMWKMKQKSKRRCMKRE